MDRDHPSWLDQPRPTWPPEYPAYRRRDRWTSHLNEKNVVGAATVLGLGALVGIAAYSMLGSSQKKPRQAPIVRQPDDAPGRTAKQSRFGNFAVTGRSVTINKPRSEVYAFWRDFSNIARFMENIERVEAQGDGVTLWTIRAPLGMTMEVRSRIVNEKEGEQIGWRSTPDSEIESEGKVMFRDAPGGRGTVVEAIVAYKPPMGAAGQVLAKMFSAEPAIQSRRDLKRLKMLLETGEIATSKNRNDA